MMKTWLCVVLFAAGLQACGSTVVESTTTQSTLGSGGNSSSSANGGSGGTGGTGGTGGSGDACSPILAEAAQAVTLHIANKTGASLYVFDECHEGGLDGISIDAHQVLNAWASNGCDELVACKTVIGDCFGDSDYEITAGTTFDTTWNGDLVADESTAVPDACKKSCMVFGECQKRHAAKPGMHTLELRYTTTPNSNYKMAKVDFELPATEVTLTIDTP